MKENKKWLAQEIKRLALDLERERRVGITV
jgi:hypothetical protein